MNFRFTFQYFTTKNQAPFSKAENHVIPKKKCKKSNEVTDLSIVECCLSFLRSDFGFYRNIWKWDEFIELYWNKGCDLQKLKANDIISLLFGMSQVELNQLNDDLSEVLKIQSSIQENENHCLDNSCIGDKVVWNYTSEVITNIEGVFLPIFDKENFKFYQSKQDKYENIVKVDSTRINLRSLALGISSGKAICLSGFVGCGKTTLVEYLAKKVGRLAPKPNERNRYLEEKTVVNSPIKEIATPTRKSKRKLPKTDIEPEEIIAIDFKETIVDGTPVNGFLRIQLGDQTDSKVLLGQYR